MLPTELSWIKAIFVRICNLTLKTLISEKVQICFCCSGTIKQLIHLEENHLTRNMSAEIEDSRDKDGFVKCKVCPRRFLTKLAFEYHSNNQHNLEIAAKLDQLPQPSTVKSPRSCFMCHLSFQSETEVQQHRSSAHNSYVFEGSCP